MITATSVLKYTQKQYKHHKNQFYAKNLNAFRNKMKLTIYLEFVGGLSTLHCKLKALSDQYSTYANANILKYC